MKSLVHTEELCSWSVPLEHAPAAKPLVCIGLLKLMRLQVFDNRAVYTRENKPRLTIAVAYIRRKRNHLYEYGLY